MLASPNSPGRLCAAVIAAIFLAHSALAAPPSIKIETASAPPDWALAERALLKAYSDAATEFTEKYIDSRGFFKCIERWGGNDGPDDVMETFNHWPLLHALGGSDSLLEQ